MAASTGKPVFCWISASGRMSFSWVRAAQLGLMFSLACAISCTRAKRVLEGTRACAGKADVEHVDAEAFHEVKDVDLLGDGWVAHRGRLQAVAEDSSSSSTRASGAAIARKPCSNRR